MKGVKETEVHEEGKKQSGEERERGEKEEGGGWSGDVNEERETQRIRNRKVG